MSTVDAPIVDDPPSGRFTWTIENFSRLSKKIYSDTFHVGGYKWYVDFCPYTSIANACYLCIWVLNFVRLEWWSWLTLFATSRRILIFPKGNNVDHLSMYLDVADSAILPYGWSRYAQFSLTVVNQIHNKYSIRKGNFSTVGVHIERYYLYHMQWVMEELNLPLLDVICLSVHVSFVHCRILNFNCRRNFYILCLHYFMQFIMVCRICNLCFLQVFD